MVWKVTNSQDGGRANLHGGRDLDKISRLFNSEKDVDNVNIDSPFEIADAKFWLRNKSGNLGYNVRVPVISTSNIELGIPFITENDTFATLKSQGELQGKTFDIRKNTMKGAGVAAATGKKTGQIVCARQLGASAGSDLLAGHIDRPAQPTFVSDAAPAGIGWEYSTTATLNTIAGIEFTNTFARRQFDARMKAKVSVPTTTANTRLYVGFSTDITIPNSNLPLANTDSGVIVGWRSTDSNYTILHNGGAAAAGISPSQINTNITKNIAVRTIEVLCRNSVPEIEVTIAEPVGNLGLENILYTTKITSNIPIENAMMAPTCTLSNADATPHLFRIYGLEGDQTM
jgi:hypothetical protein